MCSCTRTLSDARQWPPAADCSFPVPCPAGSCAKQSYQAVVASTDANITCDNGLIMQDHTGGWSCVTAPSRSPCSPGFSSDDEYQGSLGRRCMQVSGLGATVPAGWHQHRVGPAAVHHCGSPLCGILHSVAVLPPPSAPSFSGRCHDSYLWGELGCWYACTHAMRLRLTRRMLVSCAGACCMLQDCPAWLVDCGGTCNMPGVPCTTATQHLCPIVPLAGAQCTVCHCQKLGSQLAWGRHICSDGQHSASMSVLAPSHARCLFLPVCRM